MRPPRAAFIQASLLALSIAFLLACVLLAPFGGEQNSLTHAGLGKAPWTDL